jgi:putative heme-binding domain-containing protein
LDKVGSGRSFERGQQVFHDAQCTACHRFGNEGGSVGPDLTAVSSRFHRRDILESILLPSKVISEQYQATIVKTKGGDIYEGRITEETDDHVVIQPNQLKPEKVTVKKSDIKSRYPSKVSPMPEGLVDTFRKEEILDLMAYLEAGGRKDHPDFKK